MKNNTANKVQTPDNGDNAPVKQSKTRKAINIVCDVVLYLFLAVSVFVLIVSVVSQRNNGAANIFGYEMRLVVSDSMEKSAYSVDVSGYEIKDIKVKSMVFIERVPDDEQQAESWYGRLKEGDVLTFTYVASISQDVITHRITEIEQTDNGYKITLQGDNRAKEDSVVSKQIIYTSPLDYTSQNDRFNSVIGKVVGQSVVLGHIVYGVSTPVGVALIVILPCSLIMIWQITRIVVVVNEDRKRKTAEKLDEAERIAAEQREQSEQQARELEELKRKVAELTDKASDKGEDSDESV